MSTTMTRVGPGEPHTFRTRLRFQALKRRSRGQGRITARDLREFLMAYCACFLAVSVFIF